MADQLTTIEVPRLQEFQAGRREMDLSDYLDIARRNLGFLMAPAFLGLVISTVVAFTLPDVYESQSTLRIAPSTISEALVPKIQTTLTDRVNGIANDVLSRTTLGDVIKQFHLFEQELKTQTIEDVVERLKAKKEIAILPQRAGVTGPNTVGFIIYFKYRDRHKVVDVVRELTTRVVNANEQDRSKKMGLVTGFVGDEWKNAKKRLDDVNAQIAAFQSANSAAMPDQQSALVAQLMSTQSTLSQISSGQSRVQQDKIRLENELNLLADRKANLKPPTFETTNGAVRNMELERLTADVARAQEDLDALARRYTPNHPEYKSRASALESLKARRDDLQRRMTDVPPPTTSKRTIITPEFTKQMQELDERIAAKQADVRARDVELQDLIRQQRSAETQIEALRSRISVNPRSMVEFQSLLAERENAQRAFDDTERKRVSTQQAKVMDSLDLNERLDVLDPASVPLTPTSPKRLPIILLGLVGGLVIGAAIVAFRELRNNSLKTLKDVRAYTQLGVLGTVPLLEDDLVTQRRRRLLLLGWSTAVLVGTLIMAAAAFYYYTSSKN